MGKWEKFWLLLVCLENSKARGISDLFTTPIGKSLLTLSGEEQARLRKKFDIAYFIATEKLSFRKFPQLCSLEARHGVDIGTAYINEISCKMFCHYIAECKRKELIEIVSKINFFSIVMDGSTDKGNIDDELFLLIWCDTNGMMRKYIVK